VDKYGVLVLNQNNKWVDVLIETAAKPVFSRVDRKHVRWPLFSKLKLFLRSRKDTMYVQKKNNKQKLNNAASSFAGAPFC
jgi:hypothetical protein